jgi:hypothetical protein
MRSASVIRCDDELISRFSSERVDPFRMAVPSLYWIQKRRCTFLYQALCLLTHKSAKQWLCFLASPAEWIEARHMARINANPPCPPT